MTKIPPWNQLMLSGVDRPIVGRNKTNFTQYLSIRACWTCGRTTSFPGSLSLSLRIDWYERTLARRLAEERGIKFDNSFINLKPHWYKIER